MTTENLEVYKEAIKRVGPYFNNPGHGNVLINTPYHMWEHYDADRAESIEAKCIELHEILDPLREAYIYFLNHNPDWD